MPGINAVRAALSLALAGFAVAPTLASARVNAADTQVARVSVNTAAIIGAIPTTAFGTNNAVWDGLLLDPRLPRLLRQAGVAVMRYPGGSTSDVYHWQTNATEPGQVSSGLSEPPAEVPFPPYEALRMLAKLGRPGDRRLLAAHAVRQANGDLALLLINKSRDTRYTINLSLRGSTPATDAVVYSYGAGDSSIPGAREGGTRLAHLTSVPPYSLTTTVFAAGPHR